MTLLNHIVVRSVNETIHGNLYFIVEPTEEVKNRLWLLSYNDLGEGLKKYYYNYMRGGKDNDYIFRAIQNKSTNNNNIVLFDTN